MQRKCALGAQRDSCAGAPTGFRRWTTQPIAGVPCGWGRIYSFKLAADDLTGRLRYRLPPNSEMTATLSGSASSSVMMADACLCQKAKTPQPTARHLMSALSCRFFNSAPTLPAAIALLQQQGLAEIAVLIVDDGSTDTSRAVAEDAVGMDSRIRVIAFARNGSVGATGAIAIEAGSVGETGP